MVKWSENQQYENRDKHYSPVSIIKLNENHFIKIHAEIQYNSCYFLFNISFNHKYRWIFLSGYMQHWNFYSFKVSPAMFFAYWITSYKMKQKWLIKVKTFKGNVKRWCLKLDLPIKAKAEHLNLVSFPLYFIVMHFIVGFWH